ncbi:RNA deprotection pyrophosphohydrolase [Bacillus sp. FJAT-45037]|uniref:RNA deprotection pyrophosphohydrolase n=1 Tax=Bacillus sp. FJAT-45037 TaxID=2011007 RepID=UPI000C24EB11|nr:nucleoside triphosphatase YtkD [Bacillus sp. FJAT-45037]
MKTFYDHEGCLVRLVMDRTSFSTNPRHVWVICRYENGWLLTKHRKRGLEFPGGKVEGNEQPEDAAVREVMEETGGVVASVTFIGQYEVHSKNELIHKNIYFAQVKSLIEKENYMETDGPIILNTLPSNIKDDHRFSFIMKDDVLTSCMEYLANEQLI